MKVNLKVQCLATLLIPAGLYAFKRINKLKYGLVIYGISYGICYGVPIIISVTSLNSNNIIYLSSILYSFLFSIAFPMVAIKKYSIDYNKSLEKINHLV